MLQITPEGGKLQTFADPGKFPEALNPILIADKLVCVGFYSNRKDNRYNGITYFDIDPNSFLITVQKYHKFSPQFMLDKFGRDENKDVKNLVFKEGEFANDYILFNAKEYFVTTSYQSDPTGSKLRIDRYHYNDIVSVKLNANNGLVWARNINKS